MPDVPQLKPVEVLLHSLVTGGAGLSDAAFMVHDRDDLPQALRLLICEGERGGFSCECWVDGEHVCLFVADVSMALSRKRGSPVLRVAQYGEDCRLQDAAHWMTDKAQRWHRLDG